MKPIKKFLSADNDFIVEDADTDRALCDFALRHKLDEFVRLAAVNHSFRDICLAVAFTRYLTYDHAVGVVRRRWPITMKTSPKNARFWTFHRGAWVKITLRPGQSLTHGFGYDNGEGWSWERETWEYDTSFAEPSILLTWAEGGSDCDGRSSSGGVLICPVAQLASFPLSRNRDFDPSRDADPQGQPIHRPEWQKHRATRCSDQFAEAAGY